MVAPVREGDVLAGKYRVERVIGAGGMGVVVVAFHEELERRVAIKFLLGGVSNDPTVIARFIREGRAAARIDSEHVVRVMDVGRTDEGAPYMVMEYLEGEDLASLRHNKGPFPVATAVESILQACEALAVAHSLGIVHRDIKPANLFRTRRPDGTPLIKVLDFGISKAALTGKIDNGDFSLTGSSAVMGSPIYMSPEQMRSARDVDHRTDIWSLGVALYELLSDKSPFDRDSIASVFLAVIQESPSPLTLQRTDIPKDLEDILFKCLDKDRDKRFHDVGELAMALVPFAPPRAGVIAERARQTASGSRKVVESFPPLSAVPKQTTDTSAVGPPRADDPPRAIAPGTQPLAQANSASVASNRVPRTSSGTELIAADSSHDTTAPPAASITAAGSFAVAPSRRSTILSVVGALGIVVLVGVAFLLGGRHDTSVSAPTSSPSVELNGKEREARRKSFVLQIDSIPAGAEVIENDATLGNTPVQLTIDNEQVRSRPRRLVVKLSGHQPFTLIQGPSEETVHTVATLLPESASPEAAASALPIPKPAVPGKTSPKPIAPRPTIREQQ